MDKIDKLLNFKNSEDLRSDDCILVYAMRQNVQQFTKTPAKCYLCKTVIHPLDFYRSIGAVRHSYIRRKLVKKTQWRKTCGSCKDYKMIVNAWNKTIAEHKEKEAKDGK